MSRNTTLDDLPPGPIRDSAVRQLAEQSMAKSPVVAKSATTAGATVKPRLPVRPDPERFTLTLPVPPSTNGLFATVMRADAAGAAKPIRVKSQVYRQWLARAVEEIAAQRPPHFAGQVMVEVSCERKSAQADIDNKLKAALDALVKAGVLADDRQVVDVRCRWAEIKGCVVEITCCAKPVNYLRGC